MPKRLTPYAKRDIEVGKNDKILYYIIYIYIYLQSAVVLEVERWPHTPVSVGSNPSAAVDCLP